MGIVSPASSGAVIYQNTSKNYRFEIENTWEISSGAYSVVWEIPGVMAEITTSRKSYIEVPAPVLASYVGATLSLNVRYVFSGTDIETHTSNFVVGQNTTNVIVPVITSPSGAYLHESPAGQYSVSVSPEAPILAGVYSVRWEISSSPSDGASVLYSRTTSDASSVTFPSSVITDFDAQYYIRVSLLMDNVPVSSDSRPFKFGKDAPDKPTVSWPLSLEEAGLRPVFQASAYSGRGTVPSKSKFTLSAAGWGGMTSGEISYVSAYQFSGNLPANKKIYAVVGYKSDRGVWSYSDALPFYSVLTAPLRPSIAARNLSGIALDDIVFSASAFQGNEVSGSYFSSEWKFSSTAEPLTDPNSLNITNSHNTAGSLIGSVYVFPGNPMFSAGKTYSVRMRYSDSMGKQSDWSDAVVFTTKVALPAAPEAASVFEQDNLHRVPVSLKYSSEFPGNHLKTVVFFSQYESLTQNNAHALCTSYLEFASPNMMSFVLPSLGSDRPNVHFAFVNESGMGPVANLTSSIDWFMDVPPTPRGVSPYSGETGIAIYGITLSASDFAGEGSLLSSVWQLSTDANFSAALWSGTGNSTHSPAVAYTMSKDTQYYYRVKYEDSYGSWSLWSAPTKFRTIPHTAPDKPEIELIGSVDPDVYETIEDVSTAVTFTSSAYSPVTAEEHHLSSDWEVIDAHTGRIWSYSYGDTSNLVTWSPGNLPSYTALNVRVRHNNEGGASDWSESVYFVTEATPPQKPKLLYPVQSGTGVLVRATLVSSPYSGDAGHSETQWQVSESPTFSSPVFELVSGKHLTSVTVGVSSGTSLSYYENYYARVRYKNYRDMWSEWSDEAGSYNVSFMTQVHLPSAPVLVSPADGGTSSSRNPSLVSSPYSGDALSSHSASQFQVSTGTAFESVTFDRTVYPGTVLCPVSGSWFENNLTEEDGMLDSFQEYFWRARYMNESGWSDWSLPSSFTTPLYAPLAPSCVYPSDGARGVSVSPTLSTTEYSGKSVHSSSSWEIYFIGTTTLSDSTGTRVWFSDTDTSNLEEIPFASGTCTSGTSLANGALYKWRARHSNSVGSSPWSPFAWFVTEVIQAPAPTVTVPSSEDVGVSGFQLTTNEWPGGGFGDHLSTRWQLASDLSFGTSSIISSADSGSLENLESWSPVVSLQRFTVYYVRAAHRNELGWSDWSAPVSFRTIVSPPAAPSNIFPGDGVTGISFYGENVLQASAFQSVEIPQFRDHSSSLWEISESQDFSSVLWSGTSVAGSMNSVTVGSSVLKAYSNKTLYWRVFYSNAGGQSEPSAPFSMTLIPDRPNKPFLTFPVSGSESYPRENGVIRSSGYRGQGSHIKTDWAISESGSSGSFVWRSKSNFHPVYLRDVTVNSLIGDFVGGHSGKSKLSFNTEYRFSVRYQNENTFEWSEWSDDLIAKTSMDVPNRPLLLSPADGALGQMSRPVLSASAFGGMGSHIATVWQVSQSRNFEDTDIVWEAIQTNTVTGSSMCSVVVNSSNGTFKNASVGEDSLEYDSVYFWRAKYKNEAGYSAWSYSSEFLVKQSAGGVYKVAKINKSLENVMGRFVTSHVERQYPKFRDFVRWWLKFLDDNSHQFVFNMRDFSSIRDFYSAVEAFDWADEIKEAHFKNFMSDSTLDVFTKIIYEGRPVDPEIIRFLRSMNSRKGCPVSFQVLMKALGYEVTVATTGPFEYKVVNVDGKIRTAEDIEKFTEVIKMFHPAGTDFDTAAEIMSPVSALSHSWFSDAKSEESVLHACQFLSNVYKSEFISSAVDALKMQFCWKYSTMDDKKVESRTEFSSANLVTNGVFSSGTSGWRVQKNASSYALLSGTSGPIRLTMGSTAEFVSFSCDVPLRWGEEYSFRVSFGSCSASVDSFDVPGGTGTTDIRYGVARSVPTGTSSVALIDFGYDYVSSVSDLNDDCSGTFNTDVSPWTVSGTANFVVQAYFQPMKFLEIKGAYLARSVPEESAIGYGPSDIGNIPILHFSSGLGSSSFYGEKFQRSVQRQSSWTNE